MRQIAVLGVALATVIPVWGGCKPRSKGAKSKGNTPSLPLAPRRYAAGANWGPWAFIAGGVVETTGTGQRDVLSQDLGVYNSGTGTWQVRPLARARSHITPVVVGNTLLFAGGRGVEGNPEAVVDVLDGPTQTLTQKNLSHPHDPLAVVVVGGHALFFGAEPPPFRATFPVDVYSPPPQGWATIELPISGDKTTLMALAAPPQQAVFVPSEGRGMVVVDVAQRQVKGKNLPRDAGSYSGRAVVGNKVLLPWLEGSKADVFDLDKDVWSTVTLGQPAGPVEVLVQDNRALVWPAEPSMGPISLGLFEATPGRAITVALGVSATASSGLLLGFPHREGVLFGLGNTPKTAFYVWGQGKVVASALPQGGLWDPTVTTVAQGPLLSVGGIGGAQGRAPFGFLAHYNTATHTWGSYPLSQPRQGPRAAVMGNSVVWWGGECGNALCPGSDVSMGPFEPPVPHPQPQANPDAVALALEGQLLLWGGSDFSAKATNGWEAFPWKDKKWVTQEGQKSAQGLCLWRVGPGGQRFFVEGVNTKGLVEGAAAYSAQRVSFPWAKTTCWAP